MKACRRSWILALALAPATTTCQPAVEPGDEADVWVSITADVSNAAIATVVVEVTGPGIPSPLVFNVPVADGIASTTITVPVGSDRTLSVRAFDTGGVETHRASATVDLVRGVPLTITFTMDPLTEGLTINVSLGRYAVTVTPAEADLTVGGTSQLAAAVTAPDGGTVVTAVRWATTDPSVASVDDAGVVTAEGAGETRIVATFGGAAGAATVRVTAQ